MSRNLILGAGLTGLFLLPAADHEAGELVDQVL